MPAKRLQLEIEVLIVLMLVWVGGLLLVSSQSWLLAFSDEPRTDLLTGGSGVVPGRHRQPPVLRLAAVELDSGPARVLQIRAAAGPGLVVQVIDRNRQRPVSTSHLPARFTTSRYAILLDPDRLPERLRIDLRSRSGADVVVEAVELSFLRPVQGVARLAAASWGPMVLIAFFVRHRTILLAYIRRPGPATAETYLLDRLAAALMFFVCFLLFRAAPVQQLIDSKFTTAVSHYLIHAGTFALPDEFAPTRRRDETYILQSVGGKTFHFFSDAPSVLNVPFVVAFERLGIASVGPDGSFIREHERRILVFVAAFLAAGLCAILFRIARLWLPPPSALALTLVFAFGTQIFSVLSRAYWSHSWAVLLLAAAILLLCDSRTRERGWAYVAICTLLCWAYFCRPPLSLAIAGVTIFVLAKRRRFLPVFLMTGIVWAGLFAIYSLVNFDSLLPPYFLTSHLRSGRLAGGVVLNSYPSALLGTLLSPGRGLFVYSPILLVILLVVARRWRSLPDKSLAVLALAVSLAHWQLISLFRNWWGGQCFGPRLMSDILPWLFVLAALALTALATARREGMFRWGSWRPTIVALAIAASIFINTRGATARETADGAGIWNWRYPQFLAGLIPRPDTTENE